MEIDMPWDAITGLASIVGVVGGLVSVTFLILEIRRNAQAIEGATVQSLMAFEQAVFALLIENAGVFLAGGEDRDGLSPEDRLKFDKLVQAYMSLYYSAFKQFGQGLIDNDVWTAYHNAIKDKMRKPGFAASWHEVKDSYPAPFQAALTET